ncbi:hypothetical protein AC249_AIPGENE21954 [Exaiptasia diaphana]|nr:hypothetical protein AC249_AIPGENE21954 [Exaiptasia diaphana]
MVFLADQEQRKRKSFVEVGERQQRRLRKEILTPGICPGAEVSFKFLLEKEIARYLETGGTKKKIKVKLSGDGAKMPHTSNLCVLGFSLPEMEGQNILSSVANHTIALEMDNEDYTTLKTSLANAIKEENGLIAEGKIKFLLNVMGIKVATSDNSCIWCEINKTERKLNGLGSEKRKLDKLNSDNTAEDVDLFEKEDSRAKSRCSLKFCLRNWSLRLFTYFMGASPPRSNQWLYNGKRHGQYEWKGTRVHANSNHNTILAYPGLPYSSNAQAVWHSQVFQWPRC